MNTAYQNGRANNRVVLGDVIVAVLTPFIVLSVFLKRKRCPPHRLRRTSLAPSRLGRARLMPLHILRIRYWGFGPKDCIPTFAFISPWEASSRATIRPVHRGGRITVRVGGGLNGRRLFFRGKNRGDRNTDFLRIARLKINQALNFPRALVVKEVLYEQSSTQRR
jgi:hypothetical protein